MEKERFIFDIDGTLLAPDYSYEREYFKSVLSSEEAERFISMVPELLTKYERVHLRYDEEMLAKYLSWNTGVMIDKGIIDGWKCALADTPSIIIDGVVDALEYLKSRDKSMVVLTNWFLEPQQKRLEKSGLMEYFDGIYGGEMAIKPNYQSYYEACGDYSNCNVVMIGDSIDADVYGAMEFGIDAIYYNPKYCDNFDKDKVKCIGSMKEIKKIF